MENSRAGKPRRIDRGFECDHLITSVVLGTQGSSVGSKLVVVVDNHLRRIDPRYRFHVTVRWVARLVLVFIAFSWLFLYLDSVYQRRRAESLVADLKSFDFATAGFTDVRDLAIRNGGMPSRPASLSRLSDFPAPSMPDLRGNIRFYNPWPTCTRQDCTFIVMIDSGLARLPFPLQERTIDFLYSALPYIGVRTWVLSALFVVRSGKLERSEISVGEFRIDRLESGYPRRLIPFGYKVDTTSRDSVIFGLKCHNQDYEVHLDHGHPVKMPEKMLHTCVLQTERASTKRAFDMNLHCLNGILRGCRFDELAPSAWADYSAKDGGAGTRDPYK